MGWERAGDRLLQAVQGVESHPGALQAPCHALATAPQVVGEWRTQNSRVKDNPVLGHVGERPHGSHALSVLCQPFCDLCCPVEDACSLLASVKLGEHCPCLHPVQGVVAQYVALARAVADRDRKSTRLNSSHLVISYAVFCLKKKKNDDRRASSVCM